MKTWILILILIITPIRLFAQDSLGSTTDTLQIQAPIIPMDDKDPGTDTTPAFFVVETLPEFPGGTVAMMKFISDNLNYPNLAMENNITGKVIVEFIIDENGNVMNAVVKKGIGYGCDEEALRVINAMPRWKPGTQRGKNVKVRFVIPLRFQLDSGKPQKKRKRKN